MTRAMVVLATLLLIVGLGAGFWVVGGPGQARDERVDRDRLSYVRSLARYLSCETTGTELPETLSDLTLRGYCGKPGFVDGRGFQLSEPWLRYQRLDGNRFEICATLRRADIAMARQRPVSGVKIVFDPEAGAVCVLGAVA